MIEEKKKYPSEMNTKSIACRIPMVDYVKIINECVNKGISVNDWLLMKLYNNNDVLSGTNENEEQPEEFPKFPEFTIHTIRGNFIFQDENDVENTIDHLINENVMLHKNLMEEISKGIDLNDRTTQNRVFVAIIDKINNTDWETERDKLLTRKEFKMMWRNVFD